MNNTENKYYICWYSDAISIGCTYDGIGSAFNIFRSLDDVKKYIEDDKRFTYDDVFEVDPRSRIVPDDYYYYTRKYKVLRKVNQEEFNNIK